MKKVLIQAVRLSKSYQLPHGQVKALQEACLNVCEGELLAIMGPSGSGKSTLLHLLGCLENPTAGSYWLQGQDVSTLSDQQLSEIRASNIGFVFQSFNLIPQLTVYENVELPFFYQRIKIDQKKVRQKVLDSIQRVGLQHRLNHLPAQLSGGEKQRVAIARALAINPLLILADEPTGNLDTETGKEILSLFCHLNQQGVTLILVTHDNHVGACCQRLIRMQDGKVISDSAND